MTAEDTESAEDLLVKNMEYAAVIRALRANAREDAATIDQLQRERDEAIEKHRLAVIYWQRDVFKMQRERDEAREIAAVFKEYAQLLGEEINDMAVFASVHGWKSSRIEQGKVLREKIKQLESEK